MNLLPASRARLSIILPTYNRATFLPEAFAAIESQTYQDWELIVVDDGSTDNTPAVIQAFKDRASRPVTVVRQANGGAYHARNTGLDQVTGDFVAFYDSDDLWLPGYLDRLVGALERHPDVQWAYAPCQSVDRASGRELAASTFLEGERPRPFLALAVHEDSEGFRVIDDPAVLRCQISHGLFAGLQNSVIRREVFNGRRFWAGYRVTEDVQFLVRELVRGTRVGYVRDVQVVYRVHDDNSSASVAGGGAQKLLPVFEEQVRGLQALRDGLPLGAEDRSALTQRLAHVMFWHLGYEGYLKVGRRSDALDAYRRALRLWPWSLRMWKTYLVSRLAGGGTSH